MNFSKKLFFIFLTGLFLTLFFFPLFPFDNHFEQIYGAGDWNPHNTLIPFQSFEDKSIDQLKTALQNDAWHMAGTQFVSEDSHPSNLIYELKVPDHTFAAELHVWTEIHDLKSSILISIGNTLSQWHTLLEINGQKPAGTWQDIPIPGKYLKENLYIKFTALSASKNAPVIIEQWGMKTWGRRSAFQMMKSWASDFRKEINPHGSFVHWLKKRLDNYENVTDRMKIEGPASAEDIDKISDQDPLSYAVLQLPDSENHTLDFHLNVPAGIKIGRIELLFWGDLLFPAPLKAYQIQARSGGQWIPISSSEDVYSPFLRIDVPEHIQTSELKISLNRAHRFHLITWSSIDLYQQKPASYWNRFFNIFLQYQKSAAGAVGLSFLFMCMIFFPGFLISKMLFRKFLPDEGHYAFGFFFGLMIYLIFSVLGLIIKCPRLYWTLPLFSILSCIIFFWSGWYRQIKSLNFVLLCILPFHIVFSNLYQHQRDIVLSLPYIEPYLDGLRVTPLPYFGYYMDNIIQWRIAKAFLHGISPISSEITEYIGAFAFFHRTPLLPLLNVPFLSLFGESHFIYERFLTFAGGIFLIPLYLVLKEYFNARIAKISSLCLLLNLFVFLIGLNVEVYIKYLCLYFIFLSLYLLEKYRLEQISMKVFVALIWAAAYLTHAAIAMVYVTTLVIYFLAKDHFSFSKIRHIAFAGLGVFIFLIPWLLYYAHYQAQVPVSFQSTYTVSAAAATRHDFILNLASGFKAFFWPQLAAPNFGNNIGFIKVASPGIFLIFLLSIFKYFKSFKSLYLLIFVPGFVIAFLSGTEFNMFSHYFGLPLLLGFAFFYLSHLRSQVWKIFFLLIFSAEYIFYNLSGALKIGYLWMPEMKWADLSGLQILLFFAIVSCLLFFAVLILKEITRLANEETPSCENQNIETGSIKA